MDDHEHNIELAKVKAETARLRAEIIREEAALRKETALRDKLLREAREAKQRNMLKKMKK